MRDHSKKALEDRTGLNKAEYASLLLRLEKMLGDPDIVSLKVKVVYQEKHRPNRYEGREFKLLEDDT